jgi:hypothetical protein
MILWWIGDIVLLLVVVPIVVYLLRGVLNVAEQAIETIAGVANYGASLDVILDDA